MLWNYVDIASYIYNLRMDFKKNINIIWKTIVFVIEWNM